MDIQLGSSQNAIGQQRTKCQISTNQLRIITARKEKKRKKEYSQTMCNIFLYPVQKVHENVSAPTKKGQEEKQ